MITKDLSDFRLVYGFRTSESLFNYLDSSKEPSSTVRLCRTVPFHLSIPRPVCDPLPEGFDFVLNNLVELTDSTPSSDCKTVRFCFGVDGTISPVCDSVLLIERKIDGKIFYLDTNTTFKTVNGVLTPCTYVGNDSYEIKKSMTLMKASIKSDLQLRDVCDILQYSKELSVWQLRYIADFMLSRKVLCGENGNYIDLHYLETNGLDFNNYYINRMMIDLVELIKIVDTAVSSWRKRM